MLPQRWPEQMGTFTPSPRRYSAARWFQSYSRSFKSSLPAPGSQVATSSAGFSPVLAAKAFSFSRYSLRCQGLFLSGRNDRPKWPGQVVLVPDHDARHGRVVLQRQAGVRVDAGDQFPAGLAPELLDPRVEIAEALDQRAVLVAAPWAEISCKARECCRP